MGADSGAPDGRTARVEAKHVRPCGAEMATVLALGAMSLLAAAMARFQRSRLILD